MRVSTYMDADLWVTHGPGWLAQVKSGFLLGQLPDDAVQQVEAAGIVYCPATQDNKYQVLAERLTDGRCLFGPPDVPAIPDCQEDVACYTKPFSLAELVAPIHSLFDRARVAELIQARLGDTLLSAQVVAGTWDFWGNFAGFQTYLEEKRYVDRRPPYDDLLLNFFVASFDEYTLKVMS